MLFYLYIENNCNKMDLKFHLLKFPKFYLVKIPILLNYSVFNIVWPVHMKKSQHKVYLLLFFNQLYNILKTSSHLESHIFQASFI